MTSAIRNAGAAPVIRQKDLDPHFQTLAALGVKFPADIQQEISARLISASQVMSPKLSVALQHHSILKVQRSFHASMLNAKFAHDAELAKTGLAGVSFQGHKPKFKQAVYSPHSAFLTMAHWQDDGSNDGGDGDGGWDDGDGSGPGLLQDGNGGDGGDGGGYYDPDGYDPNFMGSTWTSPSGQEIQMCTVYNSFFLSVQAESPEPSPSLIPSERPTQSYLPESPSRQEPSQLCSVFWRRIGPSARSSAKKVWSVMKRSLPFYILALVDLAFVLRVASATRYFLLVSPFIGLLSCIIGAMILVDWKTTKNSAKDPQHQIVVNRQSGGLLTLGLLAIMLAFGTGIACSGGLHIQKTKAVASR